MKLLPYLSPAMASLVARQTIPTAVPTGLPASVPAGLPTAVPTALPTGIPDSSSIPSTASVPNQNSVQNAANDVKTTFTTWDGCMSKAYCKWPAIVAIVIGSIILITLLWCVGRCICCGKDLVCCCFRCCGRHNADHKQPLPSAPATPYNNQYQSHAAPLYGPNAFSQTATFESGKKGGEDALPAMPSWETAASKKVEVLEQAESHEMERLKNDHSPTMSGTASPSARPIPMRNGSSQSGAQSPRLPGYNSPYGQPSGYGSRQDVYGSRNDVSDGYSGGGYRGAAAANTSAASAPQDRYGDGYGHSPYGGGTGAAYGSNSNSGYGNNSGSAYGNTSNPGYGGSPYSAPPARTASPYGSTSNLTHAATGRGGYASPPQNEYGNDYGNDRYDSPAGGRSQGTGNGGYQTYNGNNGNSGSPYTSNQQQYSTYNGSSGYGR